MKRLLGLFALLAVPSLSAQSAPPRVKEAPTLKPGDVLEITVWREAELSGEFLVDETGEVTLPLLGRRRVLDQDFSNLRDSLLVAYQRELRNPSIVITPLRRVYVLGEVNEPGLYQVEPTISLAGAIALAGGVSSQGDLTGLRVIRDGAVIRNGAEASNSLADVDIRSGDQIFVERRGWLDRNSTFLVSAMISVTSIVISLVR